MNGISNLPTPDPAEDNAFFPSPYSLSQYTAPTTDFDQLYSPSKVAPGTKILVIGTEERYMLMRNGTMFSTGNHPVETLLPLHHMLEAGAEIEVATLTGAPVKLEWWAFPQEDTAIAATWDKLKDQMKQPRQLSAVLHENRPYAALFIPGGHGAMLTIPESTDVQTALDRALAENQLIISLCHGPAGFLAAGISRDRNPFAGYTMCAFPDALDAGANIDIGYLPGTMPWALGKALTEAGIVLANDTMSGMVHQDRTVITGDSPLASNELGKIVVKNLLERHPATS